MANEFQLFQPIGGMGASGARFGLALAFALFAAAASATSGNVATAAVSMEVVRRWRRRELIILLVARNSEKANDDVASAVGAKAIFEPLK